MLTLPKSKLTKNGRTIMLALTAIFTCLIIAGAYLKIPVAVIPYSMQTFFVQLAACLLGPVWGLAAVALYIFIGLIGLPVFTAGGGFTYVLQPTFGYLIGFLIGTLVGGLIIKCFKKKNYLAYFTGSIANLLIAYICGMLYFYLLKSFYFGDSVSAYTVFISCFLIFLPGDLALTFLASYISIKVKPILDKHTYQTATNEDIEKFELENKTIETAEAIDGSQFEQPNEMNTQIEPSEDITKNAEEAIASDIMSCETNIVKEDTNIPNNKE